MGYTLVDIVVADPSRRDLVERVAGHDLVAATDAERRKGTCRAVFVECVMLSVTRAQPRTVEHVMPRSARAQPRTIFPSDSIISGIRLKFDSFNSHDSLNFVRT